MVASGKVAVYWARERQGVYGKCVVRGAHHTAEAVIENSHTNFTEVLLDGESAQTCAIEAHTSDLTVLRGWNIPRLLEAVFSIELPGRMAPKALGHA